MRCAHAHGGCELGTVCCCPAWMPSWQSENRIRTFTLRTGFHKTVFSLVRILSTTRGSTLSLRRTLSNVNRFERNGTSRKIAYVFFSPGSLPRRKGRWICCERLTQRTAEKKT